MANCSHVLSWPANAVMQALACACCIVCKASLQPARHHFNEPCKACLVLQEYLVPLNSTVESVALHIDVQTISTMYWQVQMAMVQSMAQQESAGVLRVRVRLTMCFTSLCL